MRNRSPLLMATLAGLAWLGTGCTEPMEEKPSQSSSPPAVQTTPNIAPTPAAPPVVPPPGAPVATLPAVNTGPQTLGAVGTPASYVMAHRSAYFLDNNGQFEPKTSQEVVERAIVAYRELRTEKHDDSPDWPAFNDLSLLVKYKILSSIPPAPQGQTFVYDAATRKLTVASK